MWAKDLESILIKLGQVRQEIQPGLWIHAAVGAILTVSVDDLTLALHATCEARLLGRLENAAESCDPRR